MKGLSKLDFTDAARQGAHVLKYTHNEIVDFLKYQEHTLDPAQTGFPRITKVFSDGEILYLNHSNQYFWPWPTTTNLATNIFVTKEWLPRNFVIDIWGGYVTLDNGTTLSYAVVKDMGNDFDYSDVPGTLLAGTPYAFIKYGVNDSLTKMWGIYKKTNGIFEQFPISAEQQSQVGVCRTLLVRRNEKIFYAIHTKKGEFLRLFPVKKSSDIEDGLNPDRFIICDYTWNNSNNYNRIYQLGIEEYREYNAITNPDVVITTTGNIVGAGDAKTAITTGDETSFITLNPGQEINVNMTSGAFDISTWAVEIVSDCTDANKLDVSFATAKSLNVYSDKIRLGNTTSTHDCGDKILASWTNTIKHIFYQELAYLFNYGFERSIGFKRMNIKNNSAVVLHVYLAKVIGEFTNSGIYDDSGKLTYMKIINPADAPLGSPGTIQTLSWRNSSGFTALSVKLSLIDDGSPALDGLIQFSASLGGPWYDSAAPPPGGELTIGTSIVDGGTANFYVRTNLPPDDPQLASFIAKFMFKIQT